MSKRYKPNIKCYTIECCYKGCDNKEQCLASHPNFAEKTFFDHGWRNIKNRTFCKDHVKPILQLISAEQKRWAQEQIEKNKERIAQMKKERQQKQAQAAEQEPIEQQTVEQCMEEVEKTDEIIDNVVSAVSQPNE